MAKSEPALIASLLHATNHDPTAVIGGVVPAFGSNGRNGQGPLLVAEADESDDHVRATPIAAASARSRRDDFPAASKRRGPPAPAIQRRMLAHRRYADPADAVGGGSAIDTVLAVYTGTTLACFSRPGSTPCELLPWLTPTRTPARSTWAMSVIGEPAGAR